MGRLHTLLSPGQAVPAPDFDTPFEMLSACHDRVRRSLDLLQRLLAHWRQHGADAQSRGAAADVWRYFELAARSLAPESDWPAMGAEMAARRRPTR